MVLTLTQLFFAKTRWCDSLRLVVIRAEFDAARVTVIRADLTATGTREAAACSNDANAARRMLGLALVLEGYTRGEAARLCGMDRQTLRD